MKKASTCIYEHCSTALWLAGSCLVHLGLLFCFGADLGIAPFAVAPSEIAVHIVESKAPAAALTSMVAAPRQAKKKTSQKSAYSEPLEELAMLVEAGDPAVEKVIVSESVRNDSVQPDAVPPREGVSVQTALADKLVVRATPIKSGNRRPEYPLVARRRGWEGEVLVWVLVTQLGQVADSGVEKTSGFDALDHSALKAVRGWRFNPATENGLPVESLLHVPIAFLLERS